MQGARPSILAVFFLIAAATHFSSCKEWRKEKTVLSESVRGNWLILFPDHKLANDEQRRVYGAVQDSIVGLLGLKTISFLDHGVFQQTDSLFSPLGKWNFNEESRKLFIRNGGKGLDFFEGKLLAIQNDTMLIEEHILVAGQKIQVTWYLKRITNKKELGLFSEESNWWRQNKAIESPTGLRKKVKAMLDYYSLYYEMISKESRYFAQSRVFLPFKYYQHSIGLKKFDETHSFNRFFYNGQQARQAWEILDAAMDKIKNQSFPSGKDFVIEYSLFFKRLSKAIDG